MPWERIPIMSLHKRLLFAMLFTVVGLTAAGWVDFGKPGFYALNGYRPSRPGSAALSWDRDEAVSPWVEALRGKRDLPPAPFVPIQFKDPKRLGIGKLLVAARGLGDPHFARTVILLTHFDEQGVVGLVLNRRTDVPISRVLDSKAAKEISDPVYLGGPVEPSAVFGLLQSSAKVEKAENIFAGIYLISDKDLFEQTLAAHRQPSVFRVYLGYAGWTPDQLRAEVKLGAWFVFPADAATVFNADPGSLWMQKIQDTELHLAEAEPLAWAWQPAGSF
jgi:putative AlgH/UPF0301 family transcriptional regulator